MFFSTQCDRLLTLSSRLERYAAASASVQPGQAVTPPTKSPTALRSSQSRSSRAPPTPAYYSNADARALDLRPGRDHSRPARSSSVIMSPSQAIGTSWVDSPPPPPRMFPGVVHERTRRGSLRKGCSSEKDATATNSNVTIAPRSLTWEQDDTDRQKAVAEQPVEPGE